jgi:hypothetical protein
MRTSTAPIVFLPLALPFGLAAGITEVWLPFALVHAGLSVGVAALVVGVGLAANLTRFLFAPIVDATLNIRRWYALGIGSSIAIAMVFAVMPLARVATSSVAIAAFVCELSSGFIMAPISAMMATAVIESEKGRAAGWCQAANVGGRALAGGVGIWLSTHYSNALAVGVLACSMAACATTLTFVTGEASRSRKSFAATLRSIATELLGLWRDPRSRLVVLLVASPIGVGAAQAIWPALGPEWHVSPDRVALDVGVLSAVAGTLGAALGGQLVDRMGRWWAYFGSGVLLAAIVVPIVTLAHGAPSYDLGVLSYAFFVGMGTAAWSALCLFASGHTAVASKYALLASIGNLPNAYMTTFDGWLHDQFGVGVMFATEGLFALACVSLGLIYLRSLLSYANTTDGLAA